MILPLKQIFIINIPFRFASFLLRLDGLSCEAMGMGIFEATVSPRGAAACCARRLSALNRDCVGEAAKIAVVEDCKLVLTAASESVLQYSGDDSELLV